MNANADDRKEEREFCGRILSATFTLLGLSVGFYGVMFSALGEVGPWKAERAALLPFLIFISFVIVLECVLGILAILGLAGYIQARRALSIMICFTLATIGIFVLVRAWQMFL